jgi:N,N'-diacetylchitobiose transport system permease protein
VRRREFLAFVAPSVLVMGGLLLLPLYRTVEWSFERVDYGEPGEFVGLDNYGEALTDARLGQAVLFTVGLTVAVVAALLVGGYLLAVMVNRLGRAKPWVLGILLISYVVPHVVGATMFSWLFDANFGGVVNQLVTILTGQDVLWFTDPWPNRVMVWLNTIWFMVPFAILVIIAGLQGVPTEIIEAAKIDGAGSWRIFFTIVLPLSTPALVTVFILDAVATWNEFLFALILLNSDVSKTIPVGLLNFQGQFSNNNTGLAAGILIAVLPILIAYMFLQRWIVGGLTAGATKG